jgi:hypothetical protein
MADVSPQTTFHLSLTEREYNLVMLGLALMAGAAVKADGSHKREAAVLNQKLLQRESVLWDERKAAVEKKIAKAPDPNEVADA